MTMTYGQTSDALQAALAATLPDDDDHYVWVADFSDAFVVYQIGSECFQDDYAMDSDGNVKLAGSPEPVKSVTTYVPTQEAKELMTSLERRGVHVGNQTTSLEVRMESALRNRASVAKPKAETVKINSEPLTYHRHSRASYFADLITREKSTPAQERLNRHASEMRVISEEHERRSWAAIHSGEFEYRVEPNTQDGYGGYFTIPLWMNEFFATAVRAGRVLGGLIPNFPLPDGVSSINLPILTTGTKVRHTNDTYPVSDQDITDSSGSSNVVTIAGQADVALQALEQSPAGAHLDWALLLDMAEDYDRSLESQLLSGAGGTDELEGVVSADTTITYTDGSPTATKMWAYFGEMAAQLGDSRDLPPECWLMRTARWSWLSVAEDTAGRPFGLSTPFFLGSDEATPNPVGGLISWPVFCDDAISATGGAGGNQDYIVCLRPSDLILLESAPQTAVMREVLSGSLGARIQLHRRVAAITTRYVSGIYVLQGTGMVVQSSY